MFAKNHRVPVDSNNITVSGTNYLTMLHSIEDPDLAFPYPLIMSYSPDGIFWNRVNLGTFSDTQLAFGAHGSGNGKFLCIGTTQGLISSDGKNWTTFSIAQPASPGTGLYPYGSICYGAGKYISFVDGGGAAYSTNGTSWTVPPAAGGGHNFENPIYGPLGFFVTDVLSENYAAKSTDGITWTFFYIPATTGLDYAYSAYGNGIYVTVSSAYDSYVPTHYNGVVARSADLSTWNSVSVSNIGSKIVFGNGIFVAGVYNNPSAILYSTDAITWTLSNIPIPVPTVNVIPFSNQAIPYFTNGKFFVYDASGGKNGAYSTDAITWTRFTASQYTYGGNDYISVK